MFRPITPEQNDNDYEKIPLNTTNIIQYDFKTFENSETHTKKYDNDQDKKTIIPWLMGIYTSLFLFCEYLQTTNLIKKTSHQNISFYTYVYNLLFIWLTCYALLNFQDIYFEEKITYSKLMIYNLACHIGGVGFALLGEIKALQNIAITKNFWHNITIADILAFIIIGFPICFMMLRETFYAIKRNTLRRQFYEILIFTGAYGLILFILINNNAEGVHYHVHHAICAAVLSLYFLDWYSVKLIIVHALLMGVVVEGINFFGLQEFYLFLTDNSPQINAKGTFSTFVTFFILFNIIFFLKYK